MSNEAKIRNMSILQWVCCVSVSISGIVDLVQGQYFHFLTSLVCLCILWHSFRIYKELFFLRGVNERQAQIIQTSDELVAGYQKSFVAQSNAIVSLRKQVARAEDAIGRYEQIISNYEELFADNEPAPLPPAPSDSSGSDSSDSSASSGSSASSD